MNFPACSGLAQKSPMSTNFATFVGHEIDSFQVVDVMTSNAGGMRSGGFRNSIYFWHHLGTEVVPHSADA
jgi:hypothetical protein